ncbi:transcribed hypothetical protein [Echinococcus multilocularis]|uniref:Uncharacterized protein n=1 Tax=Echinococcus multilocularis TaxID=6211 RepID=A0A068Y0C5_ECHMU|nr:transcribed hypothetical protein [Echinococcus multilocularis]
MFSVRSSLRGGSRPCCTVPRLLEQSLMPPRRWSTHVTFAMGSLGTLRWWQQKANPIVKDMYPDFPLLCDKPQWSGRSTYATDGRMVVIPNRRIDVDVHLRHPSRSRVLQKSY